MADGAEDQWTLPAVSIRDAFRLGPSGRTPKPGAFSVGVWLAWIGADHSPVLIQHLAPLLRARRSSSFGRGVAIEVGTVPTREFLATCVHILVVSGANFAAAVAGRIAQM